jgi:dTDP-4-amino-4,6-dideoxy-D-galactose acyltransferase
MIEKLEWDSDFFGYPVGQIQIEKPDLENISNAIKNSIEFKLIYLISPQRIDFSVAGLKLVDIKTRLRKQIKSKPDYSFQKIHEYTGGEDDQLKNLALQSGIYSRFKRDSNFINGEFEKLYLKWISDSINKTIADKVIVYKEPGSCCNGFVTLKFKNNFSEIGLIAVDEKSRGKGAAKSLLAFTDHQTIKEGLNKIEVVTQFENLPARKLYEKAGYEIISKKYIYHLWN